MGRMLDMRIGARLSIVMSGAMLARGRRTAASWFRYSAVKDDRDRFYEMLQSISKNAGSVMLPLLLFIFKKFDPGGVRSRIDALKTPRFTGSGGGCWIVFNLDAHRAGFPTPIRATVAATILAQLFQPFLPTFG